MYEGNTVKINISLIGLLLISVSSISEAATIDLTGASWITYGDANSYSLPINGLEVMAGPGQINLYTKLGLNAVGVLPNNQAGMDDAYRTPTANTVEGFRMLSDGSNEPGGIEGSWDRNASWDTTLFALDAKVDLTQNSLVFFFANNETGGTITDNLAAWARIELTKISTGESLGVFDMTNDVDHDGQGYGLPFEGGGGVFLGDPTQYTTDLNEPFVSDFIQSGGNVCISSVTGTFVDCSDPNVIIDEEHNLGGDRAAYAIVAPELDTLIAGIIDDLNSDFNDYALHVNYRLGCGPELTQSGGTFPTVTQGANTNCDPDYALNGGDEKVFIGTQLRSSNVIPPVPEPGILIMMGIGLAGIGYQLRRSKKT